MEEEIWRPTHHPNYEVSNFGRVRSKAQGTWKILRPAYRRKKPYCHLNIGGKSNYVHRLVAAAFLGPCPAGYQVMHLDHDSRNNRADNLAYGTCHENNLASAKAGRRARKLTMVQVLEIRAAFQGPKEISVPKVRLLARRFNVTTQMVRQVVKGRAWMHAA